LTIPECEVDQLISDAPGFCPPGGPPQPFHTSDSSALCLADSASRVPGRQSRFDHLLFQKGQERFPVHLPRVRIDAQKATCTDILAALDRSLNDHHRLAYVLRRDILSQNHVYVFESPHGHLLIVVVESMRMPNFKGAKARRLHTAWTRERPGLSPPQQRCKLCHQLHVRVLVTFYRLTARKATAFLRGSGALAGVGFFDPARHCEYYDALPTTWTVRTVGDVVQVDRPGQARITWTDKDAHAGRGGAVKIADLDDDTTAWLVDGYLKAT